MRLALALILSLSVQPATAEAHGGPPDTIRVFRRHHRGSSIPARIDVVPFQRYVERVMASGAWPAHKPMESLKAGAVVIANRSWWLATHRDPEMTWHGRHFDVTDGGRPRWCHGCDSGQFYLGSVRVHSRIREAVAAVWGVRLWKGRWIKPQWSGDGGRCGQSINGWRLPEDAVTDCARRGWGWRRIIKLYLAPVEFR